MKKLLYIAGSLFISASIFTSCERDITQLNIDPKKPEVIPSKNLVVSAERDLADFWVTPSVNLNISRFFTQQWTETQYIDETNYNFITRNQPQNHFNTMYRDVLGPLKQAGIFLNSESESVSLSPGDQAKVKKSKQAIIELLSIYAWVNLVDSFGNVPYTEALKNEAGATVFQPKYDDAATVYDALATRLNAVLLTIDTGVDGYDNDAFYKGDMSKWKMLGNSLKLRMGLNLSETLSTPKGKALVESAVAAGVITDPANNFAFPYVDGLVSNPVYQNLVSSGRNDFVPADVYVNALKAKSDPRRFSFFAENKNKNLGTVSLITAPVSPNTSSTITFDAPLANVPTVGQAVFKKNTSSNLKDNPEDDFILGYVQAAGSNFITLVRNAETLKVGDKVNVESYIGGPYGNLASFANYSHLTGSIKQADYPGYLLESVEVKFMLAEAAARGYSVGGTAATLYGNAVQASMDQWNVDPTAAAAYITANPYDAANWKKSIGTQAWFAMFNRGIESWYFFRRLDYPILAVPGNAEGLVYRITYSNNEYSTNTTNVKAAATAIGGDKYTTKIFWDKN